MKEIFELNIPFDTPKPCALLHRVLEVASAKDSLVLDFFAGSGTTLHATMQLNAEDGGHRQCILVTNNENGICENVTYERNKRVIEGYTTPKGQQVEGLRKNNLRYYKTEFVGRNRTVKNMRALVSASTDLLCIKENIYRETAHFPALPKNSAVYRYFEEGDLRMMVIYREEFIPAIVEAISRAEVGRIKIYVFSPDRDPWTDEFIEVEERVELCALPAAIYDAYMQVLPRRKDKAIEVNEEAEGEDWEL